ncbi:MAG: peptide deformylase [FCB group bacterium]|nr:peptide deformylase [FCB group bacterium]
MAILPVVTYGNPVLREKVSPVLDFKTIRGLVDDMFDTMDEKGGIGLAANQVSVTVDLFIVEIVDLEDEEDSGKLVFINSEILAAAGSATMEEGCLSVPDIRAPVTRPESITLKFQDITGEERTEEFSGLLARVIQHEKDHLKGIFFTDRLSPANKMFVKKALKEISSAGKPSKEIVL